MLLHFTGRENLHDRCGGEVNNDVADLNISENSDFLHLVELTQVNVTWFAVLDDACKIRWFFGNARSFGSLYYGIWFETGVYCAMCNMPVHRSLSG